MPRLARRLAGTPIPIAAVLAAALLVGSSHGANAPLYTSELPAGITQDTVAPAFGHEQEPDRLAPIGTPGCLDTSNNAIPPAGQCWIRQNRLTLKSVPAGALNDPWRPTTPVLDVDLEPGDINNVSGNHSYRAEVYDRFPATGSTPAANWPDPPGSTRRYELSVYIDPAYTYETTTDAWGGPIFTQIKGYRGGSPVRSLQVKRDRFYSDSSVAGRFDLGPAVRGTWVRFAITETLSTDPTIGGAQIERNGSVIVPWRHLQTLENVSGKIDPVYLKVGAYASALLGKPVHLQIGGVRVYKVSPPA